VDIGSTTLSTAAVATAASTAVPPAIKIRKPAWAAKGWLAATIPLLAMTTDRREGKYCEADFIGWFLADVE
jgi:hypothetical protein